MKCDGYRARYARFTTMPLARDVHESEEYSDWCHHLHTCDSCSDWYQARQVEGRGHRVSGFPCVHIGYHATHPCSQHEPHDCPDVLVIKTRSGYALPVRDGGSSVVDIQFCPWCGVCLDAVRRPSTRRGRKTTRRRVK